MGDPSLNNLTNRLDQTNDMLQERARELGVQSQQLAQPSPMPDEAQSKVVQLADLLVQVHLGLAGDPDVRASGLSSSGHPAVAPAQPYIAEVDKRVKAVTKAAIDLSNSAKGGR